jgi:ribonuclease VapC
VPVDAEQARIARDALRKCGTGRYCAGLNFGDCFSYALCRALDQPLLFKGSDFSYTDVDCHTPTRNSAHEPGGGGA